MAYSVTEDYYRIRWAGSAALHGDSCLYTRARFEKPAEEVEELVLLSLGTGRRPFWEKGFPPSSRRTVEKSSFRGRQTASPSCSFWIWRPARPAS